MKLRILAFATGIAAAIAMFGTPALATTPAVSNPCGVQGWYVNPDETDNAPDMTKGGFLFKGKDLIHHATAPLDFPDVKPTTGSFVATIPGKVVFKMETENPYSTIVQQADGKFWSTAMTYDQEGGQGHPVANVSDLLGKDVKPGKVKFGNTSHVVTFGVGYWDEPGYTVVTSIKFHGVTYKLNCLQVATTKPTVTPTTSPPTTPPTTRPTTQPTSASPSASTTPPVIIGVNDAGTNLPLTGPPIFSILAGGIALVVVGIIAFVLTVRRRKNTFTA